MVLALTGGGPLKATQTVAMEMYTVAFRNLEFNQALAIDVRFALGSSRLSFFSVVSTIGTPTDITAQELRIEAFFPSDDATHQAWTRAMG